ncbi:hypothetical protein BJ978_000316 [Agromyces terreus]|uniref:Cadherin domain-containing protein n=1 Tax=Agromyces terreus TaxID=424795 RepID=A0A9X2KB07_9MICO|nr:Ig-like domain-containing protein [Agromyces terreus]MCP2369640.1 hypothetical protein [Agromyces terreus]
MSHASSPHTVDVGSSGRMRHPRHALILLALATTLLALAALSVAFASPSRAATGWTPDARADAAASALNTTRPLPVQPETQLRSACALKGSGLLRAATSPQDCWSRFETAVAIWPGPTTLCMQLGVVRAGLSATACTRAKPKGTVLVVPSATGQTATFCAGITGLLRSVSASTRCLPLERRYIVSNQAPTGLTLSGTSVAENRPAGTDVGAFALTDPDPAATPSFALVAGAGSTDNGAFTIVGATLRTAASFDFEAKSSYAIRVRGSDGYGGSIEKAFTIRVTDVVENVAPVAGDDEFTAADAAVGNTVLVVDDPSDGAPAASGPHKSIAGDLLANDVDADGDALAIVAGTVTTESGGTAELQVDGDFVFTPAAASSCTDASDAFEYTVTDGIATDTGRVSIALDGCVWYVSNSAPGDAGTSTEPFDTLAQAEAAGAGDIFVFAGDGTPAGLDTGVRLDAGQRLIGQAADLVVDGATLYVSDGSFPAITAPAGTDAVELDHANTVAGIIVYAPHGGVGIAGGSGAADGELRWLRVLRLGEAVPRQAVELDGTSGTFTIAGLYVLADTGVRLHDAGTVEFTPDSGNDFLALRAAPLVVSGTALGTSGIDSLRTFFSSSGGLRMAATTGTLTIDHLDLMTFAEPAALQLEDTGPVVIRSGSRIWAADGVAVDIDGSDGEMAFDTLTSHGADADAISIEDYAGTFTATAGGSLGPSELAGAAGTAFRVSGGDGDISYAGSIADGGGPTSVEITGRTGGTVTLSGAVVDGPDAGGGIRVTGNTGGATVFSGAGTTLQTGSARGVEFSASDGHSLSFTGGGLDIRTTSGQAFLATSSGSVAVTGEGNVLESGTGIALNIVSTDIAASGATFERVSADGANTGLQLWSTGSAGSLTVTGSGDTSRGGDASGGTIAGTSQSGVVLYDTLTPSLTNMRVESAGGHGIGGSELRGLSLRHSTVADAGNADAVFFALAGRTNITGTVDLTGNVFTDAIGNGIMIVNAGGTIDSLTIADNLIAKDAPTSAGAAIRLGIEGTVTGAASLTRAEIASNTIRGFAEGTGLDITAGNPAGPTAAQLGTPNDPTKLIAVTGNRMDGGTGGLDHQPDSFARVAFTGNARGNVDVSDNGVAGAPLRSLDCTAIDITAAGLANVTAKASNNLIDAGSRPGCPGISVSAEGLPGGATSVVAASVVGNSISRTGGPGIAVESASTGSEVVARVTNNVVTPPTGFGYSGIEFISGAAGQNARLCAAITGNTTAGGVGPTGPERGIRLVKSGADPNVNAFGIQGLAPSPAGAEAVEPYLTAQNTSTGGIAISGAASGFTACTPAP